MEKDQVSDVEQESEKHLIGGDPYGADSGDEDGGKDEVTLGDAESAGELDTDEASPEASVATKPKRPLYEGILKSFEDPNELATYARELEKKQIELEAKLGAYSDVRDAFVPKAATTPVVEEDYAERLFTDPKGVLDEIRTRIRSEIFTEVAQKEEQSAFWGSFYAEAPDLVGAEDLVELVLNKHKIKWKDVPVSQAKKLQTTEVRSRVSAIRSGGSDAKELPKKTATAVGAGGASVPKMKSTESPLTFIDQMRALRTKRSSKAG